MYTWTSNRIVLLINIIMLHHLTQPFGDSDDHGSKQKMLEEGDIALLWRH